MPWVMNSFCDIAFNDDGFVSVFIFEGSYTFVSSFKLLHWIVGYFYGMYLEMSFNEKILGLF